MVAGTVGGLVFGFFGAGSASDWHAAGRLIIVPGPALSFSIGPAAKAAGEVAACGIEAAEVGADCSGMLIYIYIRTVLVKLQGLARLELHCQFHL